MEEKQLFSLPCKYRMRQGRLAMEAWLSLISSIFKDKKGKTSISNNGDRNRQTLIIDWIVSEFGEEVGEETQKQ